MSLISDYFSKSFFFSVIGISVGILRMLNFVSSRFIYLVRTVPLDLCFACKGGGMSPLKRSEIGDQNLQLLSSVTELWR